MLSAEQLLASYANGIFPMARAADDPQLHWYDPPRRGVLPVGGVHASRSLRRNLRRGGWRAEIGGDFSAIVAACADRDETWINAPLTRLYAQLHASGHAHALAVLHEGQLAGGVFGVSLGTAFFGESMFHEVRDASKVALVHLMGRLRATGYRLADTQFVTEHLAQFGAEELPRHVYKRRLVDALGHTADWNAWPTDGSVRGGAVLAALGTGDPEG